MTPNRFKNKVVIVTGGHGGIGLAVATQLINENATVLCAEVNVTDVKAVYEFFSGISYNSQWSYIDSVINCAGVMGKSSEDMIAINYLGAVNMYNGFSCLASDDATFITVSSIHSQRSGYNDATYAATKGAIEAYTRAISSNPQGIRCNCVCPGAVDTPMLRANPDYNDSWIVNTPESIAEVICFLASDDSRAINGATIIADKGVLAKL